MHIHKRPIHTCPSTHRCNCSDRMDRCPIVLAMDTRVHVCATPTRSAYTHLHTVLSICMHAPTHAQLPCQDTHTHKTILLAHIHTCTHTQSLHNLCFPPVPFSHWGVHPCVCVNLPEPPTCYVWVHPPSGPHAQHWHCPPKGWSPPDSWVPHGSRALAPAQAFGPSACSRERSNSTISCRSPGAKMGLILPKTARPAPRTLGGMMPASPGTPRCPQLPAGPPLSPELAGSSTPIAGAQHAPETLLGPDSLSGWDERFYYLYLFSGGKLRSSPCVGLPVSRTGTVRGAGGATCYRPGGQGHTR